MGSDSENDVELQALLTDDTSEDDESHAKEDDELDADRELADEEDIAAIIKEVEATHNLTREDDRLGRHAVTKVSIAVLIYMNV